MFERRADPINHLLDRLDAAAGHRHRPENNAGLLEQLEKPEIIAAMRILDRDLVDRQLIHAGGQLVIAVRVSLLVILIIKMIGISTADMDSPADMGRHLVKTALQPLKPEILGIANLPREQRFIHLDMAATGIDKGEDLLVDCTGQLGCQLRPVMVMAVRGGIHDGQRAGKGEFHRTRADRLAGLEIMRAVGRTIMADRSANGRKIGLIGTVAKDAMLQILEIETGDMTAVIMDIVLAPHLAIGRQIDAGIDLQPDHLFGGTAEQRLVRLGQR